MLQISKHSVIYCRSLLIIPTFRENGPSMHESDSATSASAPADIPRFSVCLCLPLTETAWVSKRAIFDRLCKIFLLSHLCTLYFMDFVEILEWHRWCMEGCTGCWHGLIFPSQQLSTSQLLTHTPHHIPSEEENQKETVNFVSYKQFSNGNKLKYNTRNTTHNNFIIVTKRRARERGLKPRRYK